MLYRDPQLFFLLLLLPVLAFFYYAAFRWKKKTLHLFGNSDLVEKLADSLSPIRERIKAGLLLCAFLMTLLALTRPLWGTRFEVLPRKGVDIVVALDVSTSMLAEDISPSRIKRAKYELGRFIDQVKGDRVGIVAFAGDAFVPCPLTTDYGAAKMQLDVLDPGSISSQGTALSRAIGRASALFNQKENKFKVMVLITDGEDNLEDPVSEAEKAKSTGVIIYTLGIGTQGGVPIPLQRRGDDVIYKKDLSGNTVLTTLNEDVLYKVADATGGKYFHSTGSGLELERIYQEIEKLDKKDLKSEEFDRYNEQFMWPLGLGLILLLLEFFLSSRKKAKTAWGGRFE
ncbi:MAG: hypothetical protein A2293_09800 [Elusimicrobia bacterium RIFOXYB2_FULL_49_7]|nr:MAG: hypothetical protein A2293_09800 [Elusimicrobia bacterium RIFOXYB2_FULL_49_7]